MYKKVLTIQDISCVGQCSLTVALPILSCLGHETCVLPTSILSTHTMGFKDFTFHDLNEEMPKIINHWKKENIKFDAVYTGYLGEKEEIKHVLTIFNELINKDGLRIVDPVMADFGKLYPNFDNEYVEAVKELVKHADIILPNITEACLLTGKQYKEIYDKQYIEDLVKALNDLGPKVVVLTGVSFNKNKTGVVVFDGTWKYYEHEKINKDFHGTGDIYSSTFTGYLLKGLDVYESAKKAADFVTLCIIETMKDPSHTYGVEFEKLLPKLMK